MLADLKFAVRLLLKSPGFTAVAIVTLAVAIGVNSAIFSLVHGVVLRPLVSQEPEAVVSLFTAKAGAARDYRQFSHAEYAALRSETSTFAEVAATNPILTGIEENGNVRRCFAFFATENFFALVGTTPQAGRFFNAAESQPNTSQPVVVVSHRVWKRHGGRADFVGGTLRINGQPHTVIGITRPEFSGLNAFIVPEIWLPFGQFSRFATAFGSNRELVDLANPRNYSMNLAVRLAPGVTTATLPARLPALAERLDALGGAAATERRELQFNAPSRLSISNEPVRDPSVGSLAASLFGMSGCVLLIACVNLANMLLARSTARAKEIAVRVALGSTRWQIIRQLLIEGLVLALAGGLLGLLFALWANELLLRSLEGLFSTMSFSIGISAAPNPAVLAATLGWCLLATVLFALGPALRASRTDLVSDLKRQSGEAAVSSGFNRFFAPRQLLVMAQIALSVMLLFSAALFVRGAQRAGALALGFDPSHQIVAELDSSLANRPAADAQRSYFAALDRVRQLPGVEHAALGTQLPYGNTIRLVLFHAAGAPATEPGNAPVGADALLTSITAHWHDAMGVRLLRGRDFTPEETRDAQSRRVAIVDETLARRLFPEAEALGQRIRYAQPPSDGSPAELEIVGICAPHRHDALHNEDRARVFVPFAQNFSANVFLHVRYADRTGAGLAAAVDPLRRALHAADPGLPVLGVTPMSTLLDRNIQLWIVRLGGGLFGAFGMIALLLSVVGVYGVKSYAVDRRSREIGIRMALGARPGEVLRLVLGQGLRQTALAIGLGLLLALGAGHVLGSMLTRVSPQDPVSLVAAALILGTAASLATWIPARRATQVDPARVLRSE